MRARAFASGLIRPPDCARPVSIVPPIIERKRAPNLLCLLQTEAGKTLDDAIGEWREAIDFCRYYAQEARRQLEPESCADRQEKTIDSMSWARCIPLHQPMELSLVDLSRPDRRGACRRQ